MARTKQTGPEVKLYQIDTMVYLGTKNILTKLSMFAEFIKCGGVAIADGNGINRAKALERFDKNYKIQEITSLTIDGQANETWLRKNGLLQSQNGKYELSPIAEAILDKRITLTEYCFLLLSKQWIRIKELGGKEDYMDNLLFIILEDLIKEPIKKGEFVSHFGEKVLNMYKDNYEGLSLSNQEAARFLIEPLLLSNLMVEDEDNYILNSDYFELANDYIINHVMIKKFDEVSCPDEEYWNDFHYGFYDIVNDSNQPIYSKYYPHLFNRASANMAKAVPFDKPLQQIFYGAPGTGKSFQIDKDTNENNRIRTTFHPDYDYATFVGAYKPTVKAIDRYGLFGKETVVMKHEDNSPIKEEVIVYKFIPQSFIKAYVEAWHRYADAECKDKDFYLIIEEINRGNCAQIFGDLFQLLDRTNAGFSSYAVATDSDLQRFLNDDEEYKLNITLENDISNDNGKVIAKATDVASGKVLILPPNLHIWATMNTSDQSLFPIDSAFKRRWDWKYVPIKYDNTEWKVVLSDKTECKWTDLQQTLNDLIYEATDSEDKMLGDWFVKADSQKVISEETLVGKIIFYLWNDVAKIDAGRLFDLEVEKHGKKRKVIFSDFYMIDGKVNTEIVKEWLKKINVLKEERTEDNEQKAPEQ